VATLILILIAVAAAAALYLWLVAWQGGVTSGIGSPTAQYTVTIGGSTSVYPFAQQAANWFDANNSNIVISVNQGGSGAGMAAVCSGQVNIGQASTFYGSGAQPAATPPYLQTNYACPQTVAMQVVAYDGVDAIVASSNPHALNGVSYDTLQSVFSDASTTAPSSGFVFLAATNTLQMDGQVWAAANTPAQGTGFVWDQLPAFPAAAIGSTYSTTVFAADTATPTTTLGGALGAAEAACTVAPYTHDLCSTVAADATSCGFTICAGGTGAGVAAGDYQAPIGIHYRSDVSGTTQSFIARVLAVGATTGLATGIGFTGCSGDNQFDGCGVAFPSSGGGSGNPAVIAGVAGSVDAIGYASDGLVQTAGSGVLPVNLQGYGQSVVVNIQGESTALKAIAKGISDHETNAASIASDQAYVGWRPFVNVETAKPTGEVLRYLQFVMDPANNEALAAATAEISVYASGLAGTVPIVGLS
jgi:ABC-type phosphate transport system substrate-binding protein